MKFRLIGICALFALPLSAFALPPTSPYYDDCAQPWERPERNASEFEWDGWVRVANRYISCLSDYQQESYRNAQEFADAYNSLLEDTNERIRRRELTQHEVTEIEEQLEVYRSAFDAWKESGDDAEKQAERFARKNGAKLTKNR